MPEVADTQIVFFWGQSSVATVYHTGFNVKDSTLNIGRGKCWAYKGLWSGTGSIVDWNDLPTEDSSDLNHPTSYFFRDETTVASGVIQAITDSFPNHFWIFGKYAVASTYYGNWKPVYNITANHWGDSLSTGQYPVFNTWLVTMRKILVLLGKDSSQVNSLICYHGENEGQQIGNDTAKIAKSKRDLRSLIERQHIHFPNAKIFIIETTKPSQPMLSGFVNTRLNQKWMAANYSYVYDIDSTTYLIPNSDSYDGLHLRLTATHSAGRETVKNLRQYLQ
jgi:hypothetical protein